MKVHAQAEVSQNAMRSARPAVPTASSRHITAHDVRHLCGGVSDMSLWRWLQNSDLNFPKPIYIGKRRYWKEAEIVGWLEAQSEPAE